MNDTRRSTSITVIGWIWICIAAFMAFSGFMASVVYYLFLGPEMQQARDQLPEQQVGPLFTFMFEYFGVLSVFQVLFAVFIVYSAIMFLRLKAWARLSLEIITWLSLLYIVGFGLFWIVSWFSMTGQIPDDQGAEMLGAFQIFGAIMGAVITLVFAVPLGIIIKYLRGEKIREQCVS